MTGKNLWAEPGWHKQDLARVRKFGGGKLLYIYALAAIMNLPKFNLLFLFLSLNILVCCNDKKGGYIISETINSNQGISLDTLNFVYDGPENFTLDYFPIAAIRKAKVKECEIIERDTTSSRVTRKIQFDQNGNIIKDKNNFFSYWFEGTVRGIYDYTYNGDRKLKMIVIPEEDSKDSIMTLWNYNTQGLLYSRDAYRFAKRLKPGADKHLPNPTDYEKYPTWNKQETYQFLFALDTVTIEILAEGKVINKEKYQLLFDSTKRLKAVNKFQNASLVETTDYTYEPNSITGFIQRTMNDGTKWKYKSKAVLNDKGKQIEKIVFNDDGTEKVKMIVSYNENGTIESIKYGNTIQEFRYSHY